MQEYPVTGGIGLPSNIPNLIAVRGDSESLKSITAPELNLKIKKVPEVSENASSNKSVWFPFKSSQHRT